MDFSIQTLGIGIVVMGVLMGAMTRKQVVPVKLALIGVVTFVAGTFLP